MGQPEGYAAKILVLLLTNRTVFVCGAVSRADASESFCSRSQNASFFLLGLRGVENFPEHIPVQDRHQEKHLEQGKRNSDIRLLGKKTESLIPTECVSAEWMKLKDAASLQNDLLVVGHSSNFIDTIFTQPQCSHRRRLEYTGKPTQPPPQTK